MKLTISIAQISVKQSDPETNLRKAETLIAASARSKSDIILFPEMWTTGFDWANIARFAHEHGKIVEHIADLARRYKIWINGSMITLDEEGLPSNTSILFDPSGKKALTYRKIHLFGMIHEDKYIHPGKSMSVVKAPWGFSALAICYDIRFPELFRTYALKGSKIVFVSAAFPHPKLEHWKVLIRARAIENQMYIIGANQVGSENLGADGKVAYCGSSVIIDPWGRTIVEASEDREELLTAEIDMDMVDEIRSKMSVLKDRRPEIYKDNTDVGRS